MKHALIILMLVAMPLRAIGQTASPSETDYVARIAQCLLQGPPEDWQRLHMVVELAHPGDETGDVRYLAGRGSAGEELVPYTPCDARQPALLLIEARKEQPPERRGWTGARVVLHRDGKFELGYDYPK